LRTLGIDIGSLGAWAVWDSGLVAFESWQLPKGLDVETVAQQVVERVLPRIPKGRYAGVVILKSVNLKCPGIPINHAFVAGYLANALTASGLFDCLCWWTDTEARSASGLVPVRGTESKRKTKSGDPVMVVAKSDWHKAFLARHKLPGMSPDEIDAALAACALYQDFLA
jgi:hypothetical protein